MALIKASDFDIQIAAWAVPIQDGIQIFTGSVDLLYRLELTYQRLIEYQTALKCTHYTEANHLYSLSPNEDVTIINLRSKLLILQNAYMLLLIMGQKLELFIAVCLKPRHFQKH